MSKKIIVLILMVILLGSSIPIFILQLSPEDKISDELASIMLINPEKRVKVIIETNDEAPIFAQGVSISYRQEDLLAGEIKAGDINTLAREKWVKQVYEDKEIPLPQIPGTTDAVAPELLTTLKEAGEIMNKTIPLMHPNPVRVAVMDTGIDISNPALDIAVEKAKWRSDMSKFPAGDNVGHGTHVASIITGNGEGADDLGETEDFQGIAYDISITIIDVRVFDTQGYCYFSYLLEALNWIEKNDIDVVNMSFGAGCDPWHQEAQKLTEKFKKLIDKGIIFIAAAGNESSLITYPANMKEIIAVGAIRNDERVASFSSYLHKEGNVDVVAPGVDIIAAQAKNSQFSKLDRNDKYFHKFSEDSNYIVLSGTSMASPMVAGTIAIIKSVHPDYDEEDIRKILKENARHIDEEYDDFQGAGIVDIHACLYGKTELTFDTETEYPIKIIFLVIVAFDLFGIIIMRYRRYMHPERRLIRYQ